MKRKLEIIAKEDELPENVAKVIEEHGLYEFFDNREMENVREFIENRGLDYQVAEIDILGKRHCIIMKGHLVNALLDPQDNDAAALNRAWRQANESLIIAYGKKELKPLESNIERTFFKSYVNSLLMNLFEYPADRFNEETLKGLGLRNQDISKFYLNAAAAWLGSDDGLERIVNGSEAISQLEKVGFTGKKEDVDLSINTCYSRSHYVLNVSVERKQIDIQISVPRITESYLKIENEIVEYVKMSENPEIRQNARNLVRLYLNVGVLYDRGKTLPLEFNF